MRSSSSSDLVDLADSVLWCRIRLDATPNPDSESWSKRAPNLQPTDRIIAGLCALLMRPARVLWSAVALKPSTLLHFHKMLTRQKYGLLFSSTRVRRPGPKGPSKELIDAVVEMKRHNRTWGCKRIAQQIALAFGIEIDKDVVRRILGIHFRPKAGSGGPSWLSFIGHTKDSLWSLDLFRCESAILRTYWVLVVMDQFTRRICGEFLGFGTAYYHSAVNYTSLGYGDLIMSPSWKLLGPLETANGMLLFGVSTAMLFTVIQRLVEARFVDLKD